MGIAMPRAGVHFLASLISGVSIALILMGGPGYTEARSLQGTAYNVKRGQSRVNECRTSPCQIAYLNSVEDFCLWAPPPPVLSATRHGEHTVVAWCMKSAHGIRLIPDGTITGARLVITPEYVQITGVGNLTNINVPSDGVASVSEEGGPVHGLVFTRAYGQLEQLYDWTSFVSQGQFCFRACKPSSTACPRIHDSSGCSVNAPGSYDTGVFEDCIWDAREIPLVFSQEVLAAPLHCSTRPPPGCPARGFVSNAHAAHARRATATLSDSTSSALVTSPSPSPSQSYRHNTTLTSSVVATTTDNATTSPFSSYPTLTSNTTTLSNSSTPVSSATPTTAPSSCPQTHNQSYYTHGYSCHQSCTSSVSVSSPNYSFSHSRSPSTASSLSLPGDPSTTSSTSSLASRTTPFALTSSTHPSSDPPPSTTSVSTFAPTFTSTSTSLSSFAPTSNGTSSSRSTLSSSQPLSHHSSTRSSTATPTSSLTSSFMPSSTSPQSADVLTFISSPSLLSDPTTSSVTSSPASPSSQTSSSFQCPPPSRFTVNAGSVVPSPVPLLVLTTLMIVISSSAGVYVP